MSFKAKIDFCGLADGTHIVLKSHDEGRSSTTVTCANDEGDTIDTTTVGHVIDPSNEYALKADLTNFDIVLGSVKTVNLGTTQTPENHYFALKSVSINTSNSGDVTISAQAEEVASATASRTYTITIESLKRRQKAQILNSLFTLSGEKVHLQSANYSFAIDITQTTVDGERVTFDAYNGRIECALTAKQAGTAAPTVAAGTGCVITSDATESRPDSDYASVSATVTKYLTADSE